MLYLKHNECAAAYGAGVVGSECVCVCVCMHTCMQRHTCFREEAYPCIRKEGKFYFKAIWILCHVAEGQHQQPYSTCLRGVLRGSFAARPGCSQGMLGLLRSGCG